MLIGNVNGLDIAGMYQLDRSFGKPLGRVQLGVGYLGVSAQELFAKRRSGVRQSWVVGQNANRVI